MSDQDEYPAEEDIYAFYGAVEAAGLSIVDGNGDRVTAEELRVNLYDHWGILEADDE